MKKRVAQIKGFTLIEILLVVAAIAILAGIVIIAINPNKQLCETRNAQRHADVLTILNAVYQYSIDNGAIPSTITASTTDICRTDAPSCTGVIDLSALTTNGKYIVALPIDPTGTSSTSTSYQIAKDTNGRITVSAPNAEQSVTISVSR